MPKMSKTSWQNEQNFWQTESVHWKRENHPPIMIDDSKKSGMLFEKWLTTSLTNIVIRAERKDYDIVIIHGVYLQLNMQGKSLDYNLVNSSGQIGNECINVLWIIENMATERESTATRQTHQWHVWIDLASVQMVHKAQGE